MINALNYPAGITIDVPDLSTIPLQGGIIFVNNNSLTVIKLKYNVSVNRIKSQRKGDPLYRTQPNPLDKYLYGAGIGMGLHSIMREDSGSKDNTVAVNDESKGDRDADNSEQTKD